jgi:hypothetical protein
MVSTVLVVGTYVQYHPLKYRPGTSSVLEMTCKRIRVTTQHAPYETGAEHGGPSLRVRYGAAAALP